MKKSIKRTLWGIGIVIVLVVAFFGWYGYKASSETKMMSPAETGLLADSVYAIKESFVNLYLVKSGSSYIAVDAGNSIDAVKEGLAKLNIPSESVAAILLTHTDGDHIGSLQLFPNASIYISKQEEQMINGKTSRFAFFKNNIFGRSYNTIDDNQTIEINGLKICGILVPGHTPGSMCYLINDKYLFTGDALSLNDGKIGRFNQFFNMDSEAAAKSMEKLVNLPLAEYIFTAHYGFANDYKQAVANYIK